MTSFRLTAEERETLKKAVSKFAHEPVKSEVLLHLDAADSEYSPGSDEWNHLKFFIEHHHLHLQTEVRREPNKKSTRLQLSKADALVRKFHPNFS